MRIVTSTPCTAQMFNKNLLAEELESWEDVGRVGRADSTIPFIFFQLHPQPQTGQKRKGLKGQALA